MMDVTVYCDGCKQPKEVIQVSDPELSNFAFQPGEVPKGASKASLSAYTSGEGRAQTIVARNYLKDGDRNECCPGQGVYFRATKSSAGEVTSAPQAASSPAQTAPATPAPSADDVATALLTKIRQGK